MLQIVFPSRAITLPSGLWQESQSCRHSAKAVGFSRSNTLFLCNCCGNECCNRSQEKSKRTAWLWPLSWSSQTSCGECLPLAKTMERNRYPLCQECGFFLDRCSYPLRCYLARCFSLILCKHYLDTVSHNLSFIHRCGLLSVYHSHSPEIQ